MSEDKVDIALLGTLDGCGDHCNNTITCISGCVCQTGKTIGIAAGEELFLNGTAGELLANNSEVLFELGFDEVDLASGLVVSGKVPSCSSTT